MRTAAFVLLLGCALSACAQDLPSKSLGDKPWDFGLFAGYATDTDGRYPQPMPGVKTKREY